MWPAALSDPEMAQWLRFAEAALNGGASGNEAARRADELLVRWVERARPVLRNAIVAARAKDPCAP
jgi:hypothetical protein